MTRNRFQQVFLLGMTLILIPVVSCWPQDFPDVTLIGAREHHAAVTRVKNIINEDFQELEKYRKSGQNSLVIAKIKEIQLKLTAPQLSDDYRESILHKLEGIASKLEARSPEPRKKKQKVAAQPVVPQKSVSTAPVIPAKVAQTENTDTMEIPPVSLSLPPAGTGQFVERTQGEIAMSLWETKDKIAKERKFLQDEFHSGLARLYQKGIDYYEVQQYDDAAAAFREVERLSPRYKKARTYLKKIPKLKANYTKRQRTAQKVQPFQPDSRRVSRQNMIANVLDFYEAQPR